MSVSERDVLSHKYTLKSPILKKKQIWNEVNKSMNFNNRAINITFLLVITVDIYQSNLIVKNLLC